LKAVPHISVSSAETRRAFNAGLDTVNLHCPTGSLLLIFSWPCFSPASMWCDRITGLFLRLMSSQQGLTLVHFSAQLEPCLTHKNILHTLHTLNTPFNTGYTTPPSHPYPIKSAQIELRGECVRAPASQYSRASMFTLRWSIHRQGLTLVHFSAQLEG